MDIVALVLVEEVSNVPVRWQPPQPQRMLSPPPVPTSAAVLLRAAQMLMRRGVGPQAWVSSYEDDPVAFLMDAIDAPVLIWSADGRILYQNSAAQQQKWTTVVDQPPSVESSRSAIGQDVLYRRVLHFGHAGERYILEIVSRGVESIPEHTVAS